MTLTFKARSPEDILAVVPVVLGFEPEESVVMLTFGGRHSFHARADLPGLADISSCAEQLLRPALSHGVTSVVFVVYDAPELLARRTARSLRRSFRDDGIDVLEVLAVARDGTAGRYYCPLGRRGVPAHGVAFDVSDHPFRAEAVLGGLVTAPSRAALVARLEPSSTPIPAGLVASAPALAGPQLRELVQAHLAADAPPGDEEAAALVRAVSATALRHYAWFGVSRHEASRHVRLWTDLVTRTPAEFVAGPAALLAFAAWMQGDGAFAWCAVDKALAAEPGNGLARLVADMLTSATPPRDDWSAMFPEGVTA